MQGGTTEVFFLGQERLERKSEMEPLYTPEEVAELLRVSPRTVQRWLAQGKLQGVKVGRLWRIPKASLDRFLETGGS